MGDIYLSGWTSRCGPTTPHRPLPAQLRHGLHGSASCWHRRSGMRRRSRSSIGRRWRPRWQMSGPISLACSIRCCSMLARRYSRSSDPAVYQLRPRTPAHVGTIRQMWEHYRGMRQLSPGNFTNRTLLRNTVQAWRHWFQFHRLHKLVQKHSRHLRRQRLEALLSEAQAHERAGCTSAIFDLLRRHAPKQPRRRAQLRSTTGKLLTPKEETQVMLDYWKGVNGVARRDHPGSSATPGAEISPQALCPTCILEHGCPRHRRLHGTTCFLEHGVRAGHMSYRSGQRPGWYF